MNDDITYCKNGWNECMVTRCERHPSNIHVIRFPHSYAELYRTEYCPLEKPKLTNRERLAQDILTHDAEWVVCRLEQMFRDNSHRWNDSHKGMVAWLEEECKDDIHD